MLRRPYQLVEVFAKPWKVVQLVVHLRDLRRSHTQFWKHHRFNTKANRSKTKKNEQQSIPNHMKPRPRRSLPHIN